MPRLVSWPGVLCAALGCATATPPPPAAATPKAQGAAMTSASTPSTTATTPATTPPAKPAAAPLIEAIVQQHGEGQRARAERGVSQVLSFWRASDGDDAALRELVQTEFIADPAVLARTRERMAEALEAADGHLLEISRKWREGAELELHPELPIDSLLAATDPGAQLQENLFSSKIAFTVLLNWPLTTLDQKVTDGPRWSRVQWAEARLTDRFNTRPSGEATAARAAASAEAEAYIAGYNLWAHHLLAADGQRLFPKGKRLLSHWNLRDQIKADYAEGATGLARQRIMSAAMDRIASQEIPRGVIDDPRVDWDPLKNTVVLAPAAEVEARPAAQSGPGAKPPVATTEREPDTRFAVILKTFQAARRTDRDSPFAPTEIDRRFNLDYELPEARVKAVLESILDSPLTPQVAALIQKRLGRPLEPHDVWYGGFLERAKYPEAKLDAMTRKRYPTPAAYHKDMPRLLVALGFTPTKARWLSEHIVVDPARGSGHALQAYRRGDFPHLRTRVGPSGMDYKGYNIAVHEMGHNVEQVFSLYEVDSTLLQGVPGNAFTEALAFTFQARDLELLGLGAPDARGQNLRALNEFWATREIAGVALVDMAMWRWMYAHPDATPAQLRAATLEIARGLWNRAYQPYLGGHDSALLAVYSHMVSAFLYLPAYPIGHLIAVQLEEKLKGKNSGAEFERMTSFGRVTPDFWMTHATGAPVSADPLLRATAEALKAEAGR